MFVPTFGCAHWIWVSSLTQCDFQCSALAQRERCGEAVVVGGSNRAKTSAAGNRMHMALRGMNGWIQEMERKRREVGYSRSQLCANWKKKTLFWSAERHSVVLSPARWRAGGQCAAARVKRGRVSYSCSQLRSHLQALFCFWENAMKAKQLILANKICLISLTKRKANADALPSQRAITPLLNVFTNQECVNIPTGLGKGRKRRELCHGNIWFVLNLNVMVQFVAIERLHRSSKKV